MPSWSDLQSDLNTVAPDQRGDHIANKLQASIASVAKHYDRNILYYAKALTLYHLSTIAFEMGPMVKAVISSNGQFWIKGLEMQPNMQQIPQQ